MNIISHGIRLPKSPARVLLDLQLVDPVGPVFRDWIGIAMGVFDDSTDTRLRAHIFVSGKGDYYDIADGLPQNLE